MAFRSKEDVMGVVERLLRRCLVEPLLPSPEARFSLAKNGPPALTTGVVLPDSIPVMTYDRVMNNYGTDKPDLRFDAKLFDFAEDVVLSGDQRLASLLADDTTGDMAARAIVLRNGQVSY
jgi:aspartyl-tRNA synthetase